MSAVVIGIVRTEQVLLRLRHDLRIPRRLGEAISDSVDGLDGLGIGEINFGRADAYNRA